jgi:hypothetical protein
MFTHKLFFGGAALLRRPNFSAQAERQLGPAKFDPGNKKAPAHKEKGRQNGCAASHFSRADDAWAGIGTCHWNLNPIGCRGVSGPVPQPLFMSPSNQRMRIQ